MPTLPLQGGCHCEALRYQVSAAPLTVYNCHCTNCQKISGSAFSTTVMVPREAFEFVRGEPVTIRWLSDAGNERFGWFCGACGSRLAHGQDTVPVLTVRAGTLDDTGWISPVGDIWTRSAQRWIALPDRGLRDPGQPTDYSPFFEAFRGQGLFQA